MVIASKFQRNSMGCNLQLRLPAKNEGAVILYMTRRKIKTNRVICIPCCILYNLFNSFSKGNRVIMQLCKSANDEPSQVVKKTVSLQILKHSIYVVQVFV